MSPDALTQLRVYATQLDDQAPSLHQLMPAPVEALRRQPRATAEARLAGGGPGCGRSHGDDRWGGAAIGPDRRR